MARKSFSIHSDYYGVLSALSVEQRGALLLALIAWANDGEPVELDQAGTMLFSLMTAAIERISKINSDNGANGGRGNKSEKTENSEVKRKKPTVSDTDSISDSLSSLSIIYTEIIDRILSDKNSDKTKWKKHKTLSADKVNELLQEFDADLLHEKLKAVKDYVDSLETINPRFDLNKQIRKWNVTAPKSPAPPSPAPKGYNADDLYSQNRGC